MIKTIKNRKSMALAALRILWNFSLFALQCIAAFASDKPSRKSYSALTAQHLHDEGLISDEKYAKSLFPGKS